MRATERKSLRARVKPSFLRDRSATMLCILAVRPLHIFRRLNVPVFIVLHNATAVTLLDRTTSLLFQLIPIDSIESCYYSVLRFAWKFVRCDWHETSIDRRNETIGCAIYALAER